MEARPAESVSIALKNKKYPTTHIKNAYKEARPIWYSVGNGCVKNTKKPKTIVHKKH